MDKAIITRKLNKPHNIRLSTKKYECDYNILLLTKFSIYYDILLSINRYKDLTMLNTNNNSPNTPIKVDHICRYA